ncbi:MAG: hypothetical protein JEZ09_00165 [Salinivirgaceae bacterium]|nr:hypothetical protein [Salinivirgaceae bacterium]
MVADKLFQVLKNLSYTIISNLVSLLVSVFVILIIPKLIGVVEYGYWQLYLFYTLYVGFLHFGWNDGIYLRYGGADYNSLDKRLFFSQFHMLVILQIFVAIVTAIITYFYVEDGNRTFIFYMVSLCLVITNIRWMLIFVLQATNRIKEYAFITLIGRILYISIISVLLISGFRNYKLMIWADVIGKAISLLYAIYCCKDIVFRKISSFYFSFNETIQNISAGVKLMFATIASMLVIGVVRLGIERTWDVSTFGKVSLTLSISNMMMIFINAVGIVIFPLLRRANQDRLPNIYTSIRDLLMVMLLGILIIYFPLKEVLASWLPKYAESLRYMALLFPICIYEGKMALLINTYLKTLRKEQLMLKINIATLILSTVITFVFTVVLNNLNLVIVSIVFLLAFRAVLAEYFLSKILKVHLGKDIILELILTLVFIASGWYIDSWLTVIVYGVFYLLYILVKYKVIIQAINDLKKIAKE